MMFWCVVIGMAVGSFLFVSGFIVLYLSEVIINKQTEWKKQFYKVHLRMKDWLL